MKITLVNYATSEILDEINTGTPIGLGLGIGTTSNKESGFIDPIIELIHVSEIELKIYISLPKYLTASFRKETQMLFITPKLKVVCPSVEMPTV
jgi:hypothetical protein